MSEDTGMTSEVNEEELLLTRSNQSVVSSSGSKRGRWVLTYSDLRGVISRPMSPRYSTSITEKNVEFLEPFLKDISSLTDLSKLLILVAPSSKPYFCKKLHCFNHESRKHLCSTSITINELDMLKKYQMMFKYEIVYTEENFSINLLATDDSIVEAIIIQCKEEHLWADPEPSIKALRKPQIEVRMRSTDRNRNEKSNKGQQWKY